MSWFLASFYHWAQRFSRFPEQLHLESHDLASAFVRVPSPRLGWWTKWKRYKQNQQEFVSAVQNTELYICDRPSQPCTKKQIQVLSSKYYEIEWKLGDKGSIWLAFGLFKPSCSQRYPKLLRWTCRSLFRVFRMHNHNRSRIS